MIDFLRQRNGWCLAVVLSISMAACAGSPLGPSQTRSTPPLTFALASDGLPTAGYWKGTPVFADVNNDGHPDLAAAIRLGNGAHIWLGDGTGNWGKASDGLEVAKSCGGGVAFGDINNDGFLDMAVADHCDGVFVYLGDGQGRWTASTIAMNPAVSIGNSSNQMTDESDGYFVGSEDLALGDVNEDGFLDIVAASSDQGGFTVYLGDGSGKNWKETSSDGLPSAQDPDIDDAALRGGFANQVLLHDVNKDGHLDVVASYYAGPRVWCGNGKGQWKPCSQGLPTPLIGGLYRGMAVGDVNEDGRLDLVAANDVNGPEVYLQQPDGSWQPTPDVVPSLKGGAVGLALGDLDGDGHLDMVFTGRRSSETLGSAYGVFICLGDGKGGWTEVQNTKIPSQGLSVAWGVAIEDVNGDGAPDIAVSTGGAGSKIPKLPPNAQVKAAVLDELSLPRMQVWLNQKAEKALLAKPRAIP